MATKQALISFEFSKLDEDLAYDPKLEHDFSNGNRPLPGEAHQPAVAEATARIKQCLGQSISGFFVRGPIQIQNLSNFLHVATLTYDTQVSHSDGTTGETGTIVIIKYFLIKQKSAYRVSMDIENMPSTLMEPESEMAYKTGLSNQDVKKLVELLDAAFKLGGKIESIPLVKRGRTAMPHYLISSDERVLEYDFDSVKFHERSEFQDIKIVSSPSLGNLLLLDNLQNLAEVDVDYTNALMDREHVRYRNKEILILGGGDGGLLYELLRENPKFITMAEIDPRVIEACREHLKPCGEAMLNLEGPKYKIFVEDCLQVLRRSFKEGKKYDVIINDLTDIPVTKREDSLTAFEPSLTQQDNPWHFIESIFNCSMDCLAQDGVYLNHATGYGNKEALNAYEDFLRHSRVKVNFRSRVASVPSFMEIWVFYSVWRVTPTPLDQLY